MHPGYFPSLRAYNLEQFILFNGFQDASWQDVEFREADGTISVGTRRDSSLPFYFEGKEVCHAPTEALFAIPTLDAPGMAYIDLALVDKHRDSLCNLSANTSNSPNARIRARRRAEMTPRNRFEDPYIVAVLISLAQGLAEVYELTWRFNVSPPWCLVEGRRKLTVPGFCHCLL